MERLQYIVTTRRRKMAGHVLRLQSERPAQTAMYWVPEDGRRKRGRPNKTWRSTFKEDLEEMGEGFSSPDAPRGTGEPKSKSMSK